MISEPFAIGKSMIHRLDPRIRLSLTVLYSFVVALSYQFSVLILALSFSSILILISRVKIQEVFKRLVIVNALILLLWLVLPFTFKGEALSRIGSFASSDNVKIKCHFTGVYRPDCNHAIFDTGSCHLPAAGP
jgi:cobalt/nickel transport system permease protein